MVTSECFKCGKVLSSVEKMRNHMKKGVCEKKKKSKTCVNCNYVFSTVQMCQQHVAKKVCSYYIGSVMDVPKEKPLISKKKIVLLNKTKISSNDSQINNLSDKVDQLNQEIISLKNLLKPNVTNVLINNGNIINVGVTILAFGQEDEDRILSQLEPELLQLVNNNIGQSVQNLFKIIHSGDKFPEYRNVYTTSQSSQKVLVSDGGAFIGQVKSDVIERIIEDKRTMIGKFVENTDDLSDQMLK